MVSVINSKMFGNDEAVMPSEMDTVVPLSVVGALPLPLLLLSVYVRLRQLPPHWVRKRSPREQQAMEMV